MCPTRRSWNNFSLFSSSHHLGEKNAIGGVMTNCVGMNTAYMRVTVDDKYFHHRVRKWSSVSLSTVLHDGIFQQSYLLNVSQNHIHLQYCYKTVSTHLWRTILSVHPYLSIFQGALIHKAMFTSLPPYLLTGVDLETSVHSSLHQQLKHCLCGRVTEVMCIWMEVHGTKSLVVIVKKTQSHFW